MNPSPRTASRRFARPAAAFLLAALCAAPSFAGPRPPFRAETGLDLAGAAARAWAEDASLVYLENDEAVDSTGAAERWGYLYYSPSLDQSRGYSVRDGKIVEADLLPMKLDAPPVGAGWIGSAAALAIAEDKAGFAFRSAHQGALSTMLLMRGAFHSDDPDETTWTLIYTAPGQPSLWIVIDAAGGKVRRTWRG